MATIKKFKGGVPPTLQNGEWATNGNYAYLGMPFGEYKVFQGIFDLSESQSVSGFEFEPAKKGFIIEKDTPFSQIVELINSLPKALKYNDDDATSIDLLFEDSPYMDDTGARITFRDFSYTINLKPLTAESNVLFNIDNAFLINNSNVNFRNIKFQYPASKGALELFNSSATLTECGFEAKQDVTAGDIVFKDLGLNRIVVVKPTFKMEANNVGSIFNVIESGTTANLVNPSLSNPDFAPRTAAGLLKGGIIIIGNANNIKPTGVDSLQTSPTSNEHGGIEIRTTFADSISGSVTGISYNDLADKPDLALKADLVDGQIPAAQLPSYVDDVLEFQTFADFPANGESGKIYLDKEKNLSYRWGGSAYVYTGNPLKVGETENDAHRGDHGKLAYEHSQQEHAPADATNGADWLENVVNKPTTITEEQATAIEANTAKRSYPEADETKLGGIEENATNGADWLENIANKPTTITEEQAAAIEANTAKRSYPEADERKLGGIEENATAGADWLENVANKPTTITEEQATAIEANTAKRSYPEADETKLGGIEENATNGADWLENIANKPTTITEEQATAIETNTAKRSYPEADETKLGGIEENATNGADWLENVANKPTTITEEQATAIEANTAKRSYPEADETKLGGIEENATNGADWLENIANKPTTITEEQATAIEANTAKRSYPEADETKLGGIEENATAGADWTTNVANKPTKLSDFENDLEPAQVNQVDWSAIQNIPTVLVEFITSLQNDGVTHFEIIEDGTVLRLGHNNNQ
jgi:chorismate synthase